MNREVVVGVSFAMAACSIEARQAEVGIYLPPSDAAVERNAIIGIADAALTDAKRPPSITLNVYLRDFKRYDAKDPTTNPDFDNVIAEQSVVASVLGDDRKPVYQVPTNTTPTFGKQFFDQWYHDVPGTNFGISYPLTLTLTAEGQYEYDSRKSGVLDTSTGVARNVFLPIDDGTPYATPFGNQGAPHNYAFTAELHTVFTHLIDGGSLRFRSDDDLYVFIDKKLVIDLGGIHSPEGKEVSTDELGLTLGRDYSIDLFYGERMGRNADLLITTSFELRPSIN
jgi:fibro-slime domain-containing protein